LRLEEQAREFDLITQAAMQQEQRRSDSLQLSVGYATKQPDPAILGKQITLFQPMQIHPCYLLIDRVTSADITTCKEKRSQNR
jgi:hypothetical protein